jgi:hypothetical protein
MKFPEVYIDSEANNGVEPVICRDVIRLNPGAQIYQTTFAGPLFLDRNARIGPDVKIGRYCSLGESSLIARGTFGSYCAMAARIAVNPFNHPLSIIRQTGSAFMNFNSGQTPMGGSRNIATWLASAAQRICFHT